VRIAMVPEGQDVSAVHISEVLPTNAPGSEEGIELFNASDQDMWLQGWSLDDTKDAGSKPWIFPEDFVIRAQSYLFVPSSRTKIAWNDGGDDVRLLANDGTLVEELTYLSIKKGNTYARTVDGNFCITTKPTISAPNTCVAAAPKVTKKKAPAKKATSRAKIAKTGSSAELLGALSGEVIGGIEQKSSSKVNTFVVVLGYVVLAVAVGLYFFKAKR